MKHLLITLAIMLATFAVKAQDNIEVKTVIENGEKLYTKLQNPPTYPGGAKPFYSFLEGNIVPPLSVRESNIHGTAVIEFIIEPDGTLSNYTIVKSPSKEMGDEVIRVMKKSKKWNPGMVDGKPVRFLFNLPVNF